MKGEYAGIWLEEEEEDEEGEVKGEYTGIWGEEEEEGNADYGGIIRPRNGQNTESFPLTHFLGINLRLTTPYLFWTHDVSMYHKIYPSNNIIKQYQTNIIK